MIWDPKHDDPTLSGFTLVTPSGEHVGLTLFLYDQLYRGIRYRLTLHNRWASTPSQLQYGARAKRDALSYLWTFLPPLGAIMNTTSKGATPAASLNDPNAKPAPEEIAIKGPPDGDPPPPVLLDDGSSEMDRVQYRGLYQPEARWACAPLATEYQSIASHLPTGGRAWSGLEGSMCWYRGTEGVEHAAIVIEGASYSHIIEDVATGRRHARNGAQLAFFKHEPECPKAYDWIRQNGIAVWTRPEGGHSFVRVAETRRGFRTARVTLAGGMTRAARFSDLIEVLSPGILADPGIQPPVNAPLQGVKRPPELDTPTPTERTFVVAWRSVKRPADVHTESVKAETVIGAVRYAADRYLVRGLVSAYDFENPAGSKVFNVYCSVEEVL